MTRCSNGTGALPPVDRGDRPPRRGERISRLILLAILLAVAPAAITSTWRTSAQLPPRPEPLPAFEPSPALERSASLLPLATEHIGHRVAVEGTVADDESRTDPSDPRDPATTDKGPAELEILVLDAASMRPVSGAHVELTQSCPTSGDPLVRLEQTDPTGQITAHLDPGPLGIVAWNRAGVGGPRGIDVERGRNGTVEIILRPAREVTGRIVDATNGNAVPDATIRFWTFSELDTVRSARDGTFTHPRFPADSLAQQIRVEADGYGATVRYLSIDLDGAWEFPAPTAGGMTLSRTGGAPWIEIDLYPELRLHGRVLDPHGRPIEGAAVCAEGYYHILPSVASCDGAETTTSDRGEFTIGALRLDIGHSLLISAPGFAERLVELPPSETSDCALDDILLEPELLVAGVVVDGQGFPVEDIAVALEPIGADERTENEVLPSRSREDSLDANVRVQGSFLQARTTPDGTFLFENLDDREYALLVSRDESPLVERHVLPRDFAQATNVVIELPLDTLVLVGEVHGADGPVAGARVEVWRHGAVATVVTDADGRFRVAGLDKHAAYRLTAIATNGEEVVQRVQTSAWAWECPVLRLTPSPHESLALLGEK